jgi:hypothetical protein
VPGAPSRHKTSGDRDIGEIDRNRVIYHAACAARGHCPAIGAGILIEPVLHAGEPRTETLAGHRDPDPDQKPAFDLPRGQRPFFLYDAPYRSYDASAYKSRNLIERMFCRLKDFRRIATRYDKLARNFLAGILIAAAITWWLN